MSLKRFRVMASNASKKSVRWMYMHGFTDQDWSVGQRLRDTTVFHSPIFSEDQLPGVLRYFDAFTEAGVEDVQIFTEVTEQWMPVDPAVIYEMSKP